MKLSPHLRSGDQGDGTYRNPVLYADYSDPDVIAVGEDYYLTASSFNCMPGLPILHSRDLANWRILSYAIQEFSDPAYARPQHGKGIWAPAIRHHDGKFWIFFGTPDEGIFMTTAERAEGPWSPLQCVQAGRGLIDPCPFWDEDGQAYLIRAQAGSRCNGLNALLRLPASDRFEGETLGLQWQWMANRSPGWYRLEKQGLRLFAQGSPGGECRFFYAGKDGRFSPIGRGLQARDADWMGARIGLFSLNPGTKAGGGSALYMNFNYNPLN